MSIEKAYDGWAAQYDTNENKTRDLDKKATIETLSEYNFRNVIELGCGTGKNTEFLLKKANSVIGLDFSQEMLDIAKEKFNNDNIQFKKTDLNDNWQVDDASADLITSSLTLEHIADLDHVFKQAYDKLGTNGIFFICELHPYKQYTGSKARYETENGTMELEVYTHHITEYLGCANSNGFEMIELGEWFDDGDIPRLVSFVFKK